MQISQPAALVSSAELSPDQQTRLILRQQSPKGRGSLPTASLCIHFHSALFYFKNPYNSGLFCIWPLSTTITTTTSPTQNGEMLLSMCLFREKWPFVSAAPRHRRSRRLTPAE